ncbi:hypothetical protein GOODEAATRI_007131 [Goodea atripinnis]|uniref:Uncharacterized protein n=1 Tax=Goodea atripinnis TaxID=208336 RepID=A0ABV0NSG7_9TELE
MKPKTQLLKKKIEPHKNVSVPKSAVMAHTTIGKSADSAVIQQTVTDILHIEKKVSHKTTLLKKLAVPRVLHSSILVGKLSGRKKFFKSYHTQMDPRYVLQLSYSSC